MLKKIKVPDGYSSNISRCVDVQARKVTGLKSHDSHVLMQQLLSLAIKKYTASRCVDRFSRALYFLSEVVFQGVDRGGARPAATANHSYVVPFGDDLSSFIFHGHGSPDSTPCSRNKAFWPGSVPMDVSY